MSTPQHRLGVIVGVQREALCLTALKDVSAMTIAVTGAKPGRARIAAARLLDEGAAGLVSFGTCGALDPALVPGDVVIPSQIETIGTQPIACDPAWRSALQAFSTVGGEGAEAPCLLGSDEVATTVQAKQDLYRRSGASVVDMESAEIAEVARERGRPFVAIRAVSDTAQQTLPAWIGKTIDDQGSVVFGPLVWGLLTHPWDLPSLMRLGRTSKASFESLRRVAVGAGPLLGLPR